MLLTMTLSKKSRRKHYVNSEGSIRAELWFSYGKFPTQGGGYEWPTAVYSLAALRDVDTLSIHCCLARFCIVASVILSTLFVTLTSMRWYLARCCLIASTTITTLFATSYTVHCCLARCCPVISITVTTRAVLRRRIVIKCAAFY